MTGSDSDSILMKYIHTYTWVFGEKVTLSGRREEKASITPALAATLSQHALCQRAQSCASYHQGEMEGKEAMCASKEVFFALLCSHFLPGEGVLNCTVIVLVK